MEEYSETILRGCRFYYKEHISLFWQTNNVVETKIQGYLRWNLSTLPAMLSG